MMNNGIEMINDTLSIFEKGYYYIENKKVKIKNSVWTSHIALRQGFGGNLHKG